MDHLWRYSNIVINQLLLIQLVELAFNQFADTVVSIDLLHLYPTRSVDILAFLIAFNCLDSLRRASSLLDFNS